jgi:hypothetical protein
VGEVMKDDNVVMCAVGEIRVVEGNVRARLP